MKELTASILIIGNEILSGKVQDRNICFIAKKLSERGIILKEVRVVLDLTEDIVEAVNLLRKKYTYVFTTGGLGPTHDDITAEAIAKAFSVETEFNENALKLIEKYSLEKGLVFNDARKKMALVPKGGILINNEPPGFRIENVFVMAGIPETLYKMFSYIEASLERGDEILSKNLVIYVSESLIAKELSDIQDKYKSIDIGSYPFLKDNEPASDIVFRGKDITVIHKAYSKLENIAKSNNYRYEK